MILARLITIIILTFSLMLVGASDANAQTPDTGSSVEITEEGEGVEGTEDKPSTATLALLQAMEGKHGAAKTVVGEFEQTKESEIFLETIQSKGKFSFSKPDLFRCDYFPPDEMTNLIIKDAIYIHTPALNQVERYRFHTPEERDQQLHVMVLGFGCRAADILREYQVTTSEDSEELKKKLTDASLDPAKVILIQAAPVKALAETAPFTIINLWIDKESLLPQKIWFEDYNGDTTTIKINKVDFDAEIPASTFEANFPEGTAIIDKTDL